VALVDGRRDDQVDRAALVLEQDEGDAVGGLGTLAGGDHAGDLDGGAVVETIEVAGAGELRVETGAQELHRVAGDRQSGRAVVGEHLLPVPQRLQRRRLRRLDRQRQLGAAAGDAAGASHPHPPQRLASLVFRAGRNPVERAGPGEAFEAR